MTASSEMSDKRAHSATGADEDAIVVEDLRRLLGRDEAAAILEAFRADLRFAVGMLSTATSQVEIAGQAHKIVSLAGGLGFHHLSGEARKLEKLARGQADDITLVVARRIFDSAYKRAEGQFNSLLESPYDG